MAGALAYQADDRSLLLPLYRRWLVDPILSWLPASLSPNTITHAGHCFNLLGTALLVGLWPRQGWPFAAAALCLQLYVWCDNADGAHARRTRQTSPFGELLDHGLDILNVVYIAYLTAMALGAPPLWWVAIVLLIAGAAAITYWEQCQTGVFRLGMMNQVESGLVLSSTLLVSAVLGTSAWEAELAFGVTFRQAMLLWCAVTILFGVARAVTRVARSHGVAATLPALALIVFAGAVAAATAASAITTVAAVAIATALNVFFSMRMLLLRLRRTPAKLDPSLVIGAMLLWCLAAWAFAGLPVDTKLASAALAALACAVYGGQAIVDARLAAMILLRPERAIAVVD